MDRFVKVSSDIRDALPDCPICTDHFDKSKKIPRQLPCCYNSVCQPCLNEILECGELLCPLCRHTHSLPKGVETLNKDSQILKMLDRLNKKKSPKVRCSHCTDNLAISKCNNCNIYLCQTCRLAHPGNHKITSFDNMKLLVSAGTFPEMIGKIDEVRQRIETLSEFHENIVDSKLTAINEINNCFDDLVDELQKRRGILLSEVEENAVKEQSSIGRALDSHKALEEKIQKVIQAKKLSSASIKLMLEESPLDVDYDRRSVTFMPDRMGQLKTIIGATGLIQTVTFSPTERPHSLDEDSHCHTIAIEPIPSPQDEGDPIVKILSDAGEHIVCKTRSSSDQVIVSKKKGTVKVIMSPYLQYHHNTACLHLMTSHHGITGTLQDRQDHVTGCRIQSPRTTLLYPPITVRTNTLVMYQVKCTFQMKQSAPPGSVIFLVASLSKPTDMCLGPTTGFQIGIGTFDSQRRNRICLYVVHDDKLQFSKSLNRNEADQMDELDLYIILNKDKRQIHVVDVATKRLLTTVNGVKFDCPLWTMMYLGRPEWADISGEILTGNRVEVSHGMCDLLSTL